MHKIKIPQHVSGKEVFVIFAITDGNQWTYTSIKSLGLELKGFKRNQARK